MGFLRTPSLRSRAAMTGLISTIFVASLLLGGATGVVAKDHPDSPPGSVDIQLLAINDFHGQLPAPGGTISVPNGTDTATKVNAGGIVYLAQQVRALQAQNPHTLLLSAGDLIGASPLVSALFHDEPTIEAMNGLGMDYAVVGNHEFDEGLAELYRIQDGGCNAVDGCQTGHTYAGADFPYLAANVLGPDGKTIFPPYKIRTVASVKIGIIGVVTTETPTIVMPSAVAGLTFLPETATVNKYAAELKAKGVNTIVVLLHAGNSSSAAGVLNDVTATVNGCPANMQSPNLGQNPFYNMVAGMDPAVRVVISGHSHNYYNCTIGNKVVTGASSAGRVLTDIDLTVDRSTDETTTSSAHNVVVTNTGTPDAQAASLLAYYTTLSAPLANRVIGSITADITNTSNSAGESALGDVLADAQLADTAAADRGGAVIGMTNPGGIRTDLLYNQISGNEAPGEVTYGEAFAVQPFSNSLVTMTLTGAQIKTVLEQQFVGCGQPPDGQKILQVSAGFTYSWSGSAACNSKISKMELDGVAIDMAASYRVTVNNFLAAGGDNFLGFKAGTDLLTGRIDLDAFVDYLGENKPVAPGPKDRITVVP